MDFDRKLDKLRAVCVREGEKEREKGINDVVLEMMQSENIPPLVNWKEMFTSVMDLLADCKNKDVRDEKLLLFNLSEASTYVTQFMTDQQIENDLMHYIHPLIGEYLCKVEELKDKDSTYSKLILESLTRLLNKCLEKLNKGEEVDSSQLKYSQYNCFINYVKEILDIHRSNKNEVLNKGGSMNTISLSVSQICAFVKVASTMASEDNRIFFYFLENNYPAMVCDLLRLVKYSVLKEIEFVTSQKRSMTPIEEESYNEVIENSLSLIVHFHSFVSNSYFHQEGSTVPNPYTEFVVELLKPF